MAKENEFKFSSATIAPSESIKAGFDLQAYFGRAKTGFRKMATIPDIIAIKINQDHGINLHDTTFMRDRDKMKKLKYILTTEYPDLMVNN